MTVFEKINWKAVAIYAAVIVTFNIVPDKKFNGPYVLGALTAGIVQTMLFAKGKKDYVTEWLLHWGINSPSL